MGRPRRSRELWAARGAAASCGPPAYGRLWAPGLRPAVSRWPTAGYGPLACGQLWALGLRPAVGRWSVPSYGLLAWGWLRPWPGTNHRSAGPLRPLSGANGSQAPPADLAEPTDRRHRPPIRWLTLGQPRGAPLRPSVIRPRHTTPTPCPATPWLVLKCHR